MTLEILVPSDTLYVCHPKNPYTVSPIEYCLDLLSITSPTNVQVSAEIAGAAAGTADGAPLSQTHDPRHSASL